MLRVSILQHIQVECPIAKGNSLG